VADLAAGRVTDFDPRKIMARGRKLLAKPWPFVSRTRRKPTLQKSGRTLQRRRQIWICPRWRKKSHFPHGHIPGHHKCIDEL